MGGDNTVNNLKILKFLLKLRDYFPDRYSICLINTKNYFNSMKKKRKFVENFNDTYVLDRTLLFSSLYFGRKSIKKAKKFFGKN